MQPHPIEFVDLTVQDLDRSVDFYRRYLELEPVRRPEPAVDVGRRSQWLAAGSVVLRLTEAGRAARTGDWQTDDLQRGFRHIGFKVSDLDERAARLRDAGTRFHKEPKDVHGDVRITFFLDPDGVLLEFVEGPLRYDVVEDAELVEREHARPAPRTPRFDHVAVTVSDAARTAALLGDQLGFGLAGRLVREDDPRGFEIAYLHAGDTILELFSWGVATSAEPWQPDRDILGFRAVGVTGGAPEQLAGALATAGGRIVHAAADRCLALVPDGLPVAVERAR